MASTETKTSSENGAIAEAQSQNNPVVQNATAEVTQNAQQRRATPMETFLATAKAFAIRALIIYFIMSWIQKPSQPQTNQGVAKKAAVPAINLFDFGTRLALHVYLDESEDLTDFTSDKLFWYKDNVVYGDWTSGPNGDGSFSIEKDVPITEGMKNNGSLFLHAFVTRAGESPNPKASNYGKKEFSYARKQLNRYKKLKNAGTKNLLTGVSETKEVEDGKIITHWHPNFTLNLIADQTAWTYGSVPSPIDTYIEFTPDTKSYKPILFANDFWNMARDYQPLNETLVLRVTFQPLSLFKWQMYAAHTMRQSWNVFGDSEDQASDDEQDTLKETLLDTNPYLLGITLFVSILHTVFELLAFKNDIQFWNNRNSLEGLSVRSVFFGVFQSLVVLLYVLDNDTNTLIRISCLVGLGIELWKTHKVVDIKFVNGRISFKDKSSYTESSTKQYDDLAFKYLSWLCFPLLAGYSVYALFYQEHKGWYSFILNLLYGYLLTFGFIMMTPQLFINYKLKSVAHLPWRMLTYKFLNTFIDDMFAFVVKMPTMYRLGCFRDDIVFLVFLYQKWIYPVDKSRMNEFGFCEENKNEAAPAIEASPPQPEETVEESKKEK